MDELRDKPGGPETNQVIVEITVNGQAARRGGRAAALLLVHFLRETLGLTGTHVGCDTTSCGACTVLLDGTPVKSCTFFAVQADGRDMTTVEGLTQTARFIRSSRASRRSTGSSAGSARPGMMLVAVALLEENPDPSEEQIRWAHLRATSAAARATRTSSRRCGGRRGSPTPTHGRGQERDMALEEKQAHGWLGQSIKRKEDARFVRGKGNYVDDVKLPGMLHMAILRSPFAHARIISIDTSAAEALPGVVAVVTGELLAAAQPRVDADALGRHPGRARHRQGADAGAGGRRASSPRTPTSPTTRSS